MTNSRFEDLERRCIRLRRIRIIKVVFACVSITIVALGSFYMTIKPQNQFVSSVNEVVLVQENNLTQHTDVPKEDPVVIAQTQEETPFKQNEDINHSIEEQPYDTLMLSAKVKNSPKKGTLPKEEKIDLSEPVIKIPVEDFLAMPEEKKVLNMTVKSFSEEESLLKNFQSNNTFATAIALAQFYFDKKEYIKAISWAKESSKLEPTSDKPWIIYAKSKFHLGERAEAIRSLELFVGYVNSKEAKELLTFYKGQQ